MLDRIIAFSLRNRLFIVVCSVIVAAYGTYTALRLPIDVLPDLDRPTVTIITEAHGLVPEKVETLITRHVERAVGGVSGVERVRSDSSLGLSVVRVEFAWDTDVYRNRQLVQERLQLARNRLPSGVVPELAPITSIMGQVQVIGLRSKTGATSPTELRAITDQVVRLRLQSVPGVAQVVVTGGARRELQVIADAEAMTAHAVTLEEVADAIEESNAAGGGGFITQGERAPAVTVDGLVRDEGDLALAVVRPDPNRPVLIADVAEVRFGPAAIRVGDAGVDDGPGVLVIVTKQRGVDTRALTERVEEELDAIRGELPQDVEVRSDIFRQADFIDRAVGNVSEAVRDGAILVVIILFAFLVSVRTTFITLTAIPMSLAITAAVFHAAGISINTMTLGGIAVAVGALVDDAIVDVENVFRRLKQNRRRPTPRDVLDVVYAASKEVRGPILIGTLVVAAVYLPLFFLSGMEGRLFTPIGIAYIVSIMASLLTAVTLTPALCLYLLPAIDGAAAQRGDPWLVRWLKRGARLMIEFSTRRAIAIASVLAALVLAGLFVLSQRGSEFLPPFNEGSAQVNLFLPPGTGIDTSVDYGRRMQEVIARVDGVAAIGRRTGRAEGDAHVMDVNVTETIITFDPAAKRSRDEILDDVRREVESAFPGVPREVEQPLAHLLSHLLSGVTAQVAIKIRGPDLKVLREAGDRVAHVVETIPGVTDLYVEPQILVEQILVAPRREALAAHGIALGDVARTVELALEGEERTRMVAGELSYPVVLRLEEDDRDEVSDLRRLLVRSPTGDVVRLEDVAEVRRGLTPNSLSRENLVRQLVVRHNVSGRSLGEVVADVEDALEAVRTELPSGYRIDLSGQFEAQSEATRTIVLLSFASLLLMFLLIYTHFGSANLTLQTLLNIPMAFVGAVAFLVVTGQTLSVATLVGLVSLGGIAARNKILLLDHYLHCMRDEGDSFSVAMLVRAGQERIVPVLMTALTSGIALVPLILSPGEPGRELLYPVASVIVGGLVSTTLLDLLLTPGVFWLFGRRAAERASASVALEGLAGDAKSGLLHREDEGDDGGGGQA